jgi:hypothetical protein
MEAPHADQVPRDAAGLCVAVAPHGLARRARDSDDLERVDDAFPARIAPLQVVEGEVDRAAELGALEAQAEVERGLSSENLVHLVPITYGRMACGLGHAATPFRFSR